MSRLLSEQNILNLLLIFVPIAIVLEFVAHARAEWIFVTRVSRSFRWLASWVRRRST